MRISFHPPIERIRRWQRGGPEPRHPAWIRGGGRVDRLRRNEGHGDERE